MNEAEIRTAFHRRRLCRHHSDPATLVLDELGLRHGKWRADIAVVNHQLIGYEIKSEADSLRRLGFQIDGYNAVFDYVSIVVAERHLNEAMALVPDWWGVILVTEGPRGGIHFRTIRRSRQNAYVDDYAVAQLLWRDEAQEILIDLGLQGRLLREPRSNLYGYMVDRLHSHDLRRIVREYLKKRRTWRRPALPSPSGGSSLPSAKQ
jgi:hypothetical protein